MMAVVSFPLCFGVSGADFWGDLWLCVCRLKQLHQHQWSMWLPTCPPWEAVSHFCCFILLLPLLGQREQGEVCSCCSFPPDTTNPPPTTNRPNHQITKKKNNLTINQPDDYCLLCEILLAKGNLKQPGPQLTLISISIWSTDCFLNQLIDQLVYQPKTLNNAAYNFPKPDLTYFIQPNSRKIKKSFVTQLPYKGQKPENINTWKATFKSLLTIFPEKIT